MFLGTHSPRLDDKGRLFLPAKFRDRMADGLVVTRGQERCLYVFPMDEFLKVTQQMQAAPTTSKRVRDFTRVFLSGASDEVLFASDVTVVPVTQGVAGSVPDAGSSAASVGPDPPDPKDSAGRDVHVQVVLLKHPVVDTQRVSVRLQIGKCCHGGLFHHITELAG